ncbi:MAG TPA: ABC transporter permease, partial [Flavitalea sp.]|nr:ABC transporter permease [Flavitalea sp.]
MNKTWLIIQREYFSRVRKKSFLLTTILVPLIIIGFYAAIIAISVSDNSDIVKVAVLDEANLFHNNVQKSKNDIASYEFVKSGNEQAFKSRYKASGYDFFLYVPKINLEKPSGIRLHSESAVSLGTKSKIEKTINQAIETKRLEAANINPEQYKAINADISLQNIID